MVEISSPKLALNGGECRSVAVSKFPDVATVSSQTWPFSCERSVLAPVMIGYAANQGNMPVSAPSVSPQNLTRGTIEKEGNL